MQSPSLENHLPAQLNEKDEVGLLHAAIIEIGAAQDLPSAFTVVLRLVCEKTGWTMGQAWLPNGDGTALERSAAWVHDSKRDVEEFVNASAPHTFAPGQGLPGRVWSSRRPVWIPDVKQNRNFPRLRPAKAAGIETALGVPVLVAEEVIAVLEFFICERREKDDQLSVLIATVAAQLGWATRHKLAHDRLRASEERYRVLVDKAPICIHEIDQQRRLRAVNPAGLKMLGGAEADQVCGIPALNLVSAADRQRIAELLDRAFAGEFCEFEFVTVDVQGEPRAFLSCFIPLPDKDGIIRKVLGMSQDITNRVRALHQRLRMIGELNHHIRNALEAIQLSARGIRDEQGIAHINTAIRRIECALRENLTADPWALKDILAADPELGAVLVKAAEQQS